ncbi:glycosyltransferase family 1 protein [Thermomicrobium sp. 4228-Ro]|uniref:glycosyltransferase family 4 protein n=1 Tax=Thermomicrobium sp. 4228-Ro TaxID=2993937 RepID=UPI002249A244|nr:glycosyltransferase family 1 protein [Thermomicrobium sp. 4228-Ro]MCX2726755.1 glycosyltransferase family 1 protein [Thermomicrobium sp. 4228-Ro]
MRVGLLASLLSHRSGYRRAGVSRYIEALLTCIPGTAPDVHLLAYLPRSVGQAVSRAFSGIDWRCTRWPTERPVVRIAWEQLIAPWVTLDCDVVHGPVNVLPLALAKPGIVTVHDLAFLHFPEHYPVAKRWYLRLMTGMSVRRARCVIAVSEHTRRDVVLAYGVAPEKVIVIPNGIDADWTRVPESELARWRAERGLPERFLLFVGTIQPRKNLLTLLRAIRHLPDEVDWPLYVVGARGWKDSPVYRAVRELGLEQRVVFVGYAPPEELRYWYSAATLFVYPSLYEGFGLPVLEAMACGTPVITSDRSSLPEVAGGAALLVDPSDAGALAAAIAELAADEYRRAMLAQVGQSRAHSFTWERTARDTAEIYRMVARRAVHQRGGRDR